MASRANEPITRTNAVAAVGAGVGLLALAELPSLRPGWLLFRANRLVTGEGYGLFSLSPLYAYALAGLWLLLFILAFVPFRGRAWIVSLVAGGVLGLTILSLEHGTGVLLEEAARAARVSLMGGVWLTLLAVYIALFAAFHEYRGAWAWLLAVPGILVATYLVATGSLSDLGLSRELAAQRANFVGEITRHVSLAGTSVFLASVLGIPAAIWAARREGVAGVVLSTASFLQTLPSLALFGLMLAPLASLGQRLTVGEALLFIAGGTVVAGVLGLFTRRIEAPKVRGVCLGLALIVAIVPLSLGLIIAAVLIDDVFGSLLRLDFANLLPGVGLSSTLAALGVRGIGTAPALIALTLYSFLPIIRNTYTGLKEVPRAAVEAGRGMGMSPGQLLWRVELPLALPLIVEGLRASAVLTIGIATVSYLIGAGGLGTFIQRGIDQVVPDLILLGAIPVIGLALLADGLLRLVGRLLTPRGLR